jgi:hypothetical protein
MLIKQGTTCRRVTKRYVAPTCYAVFALSASHKGSHHAYRSAIWMPSAFTKRPREGAEVLGKQVWFFQRGKVPAARHLGPTRDPQVALRQLPRRINSRDIPWESGEPCRNLDMLSRLKRRVTHTAVVAK